VETDLKKLRQAFKAQDAEGKQVMFFVEGFFFKTLLRY